MLQLIFPYIPVILIFSYFILAVIEYNNKKSNFIEILESFYFDKFYRKSIPIMLVIWLGSLLLSFFIKNEIFMGLVYLVCFSIFWGYTIRVIRNQIKFK